MKEPNIRFGPYKPTKLFADDYIIDARWCSDKEGNKPITEAKIGDYVFLHIRTINIPNGESIVIKIFDDDKVFGFNLFKQDDYLEILQRGVNSERIEVHENRAIQHFRLGEGAKSFVKEEYDLSIELYAKVTYKTDIEVAVPRSKKKYLIVGPEDRDGRIVFQSASSIHTLPMIFDSKSGDPYYIDAGKKIYAGTNYYFKFKKLLMPPVIDKQIMKAYEFAIRRIQAGGLVFNDGTVGKAYKFYEKTLHNIDETFHQKVVMGMNRGNFKPGVTSAGINQLEAFSNRGIAGARKFVGYMMPLFSAAMDLANMARSAAKGEIAPPSFLPPFVTWEVERIMQEREQLLSEIAHEKFFENLNAALNGTIDFTKGRRQGILEMGDFSHNHSGFSIVNNIKKFLSIWKKGVDSRYHFDWHLIDMNNTTLEKLLKGEILSVKIVDHLGYEGGRNEAKDCSVLFFTNEEKDEHGRDIHRHYIYALFLPETLMP